MEHLTWTIQGIRENVRHPMQTFATKREAVEAMEADRQPKTTIFRIGHAYTYTAKKD